MYSWLSGSGIGGKNVGMRGIDINTIPSEKEECINEEEDEKYCRNGKAPPPRKKLRLTNEQSLLLEQSFRHNQTLNPKQKEDLAMQLMLKPRQVEVWFQNRRARSKLKQTEIEYDYLKRWYNTLSEQNKRLQMEVEELRAIRVISPHSCEFLSAASTSMCPRCERITTVVHNHGGAMITVAMATTPAASSAGITGSYGINRLKIDEKVRVVGEGTNDIAKRGG